VRVGGDADKIETTTFKVGSDSPYKDPTRLVGDVNDDTYILLDDALMIINHAGEPSLTDDSLQAADVNGDTYVLLDDALEIINYSADVSVNPYSLGTKTLADKTNTVQ
jgi:hypothetical protein